MTEQEEFSLELPKEMVENSCGFSLDIGGSAIKVVYRHKEDWVEYLKQKEHVSKVRIRMRTYPKDRLEDVLDFLKDNCHITRYEDRPTVSYNTGTGCYAHSTLISKKLDAKVEVIWEMDFINDGIYYLTKWLSREEFEYLASEEERDELLQVITTALHLEASFQRPDFSNQRLTVVESLDASVIIDSDITSDLPFATAVGDMYPCLIFYFHSATSYGLMRSRNDFGLTSPINTGGKAFVGLGSLFCGTVKTYDELIDMAEMGDNNTVDETYSAITIEESDHKNYYASVLQHAAGLDEVLYSFGQPANLPAEKFKKEDLVMTLLKMIIREHIGGMLPLILLYATRHVIVVGSFCSRSLVRQLMRKELARQKIIYAARNDGKGLDAQIHFPKTARYIGCIGGFMRTDTSSGSEQNTYA